MSYPIFTGISCFRHSAGVMATMPINLIRLEKNTPKSVIFCFLFYSILSPLLEEYDNNIRVSQEQVSFLKVRETLNNNYCFLLCLISM